MLSYRHRRPDIPENSTFIQISIFSLSHVVFFVIGEECYMRTWNEETYHIKVKKRERDS